MKGINWIGSDSKPLAVIIRTTGKYAEDSNGKKYNYPILYFIKNGSKYTLIGKYSVDEVFDTYVTLIPFNNNE
jgi:hypothetical protein